MEGPSLRALYQKLRYLNGKVCTVTGDQVNLKGQLDLIPYGKRLVIREGSTYIRVFFGMSGTAGPRKSRKEPATLSIKPVDSKPFYFYRCSFRFLTPEEFNDYYHPETDILDDHWNPEVAKEKVCILKREWITDVLLNQEIFCGSGNIVKNEVLYRTGIHPLRKVEDLLDREIDNIIEETVQFSKLFYVSRARDGNIRGILQIYRRNICHMCKSPVKKEHLGKGMRVTYWCPSCQH